GHIYEIYPQPELPAADLDYHMKVWINYLETHVYGRALQDEDYLFPSINVNSVAHPERPMSHDIVQKWIDKFTASTGIDNSKAWPTTHCFRKGGAQYQFMFALIGK
ncbi:hypothetical protein BU17DRAFT_43932, partial [Hysterangium stoloniferum]